MTHITNVLTRMCCCYDMGMIEACTARHEKGSPSNYWKLYHKCVVTYSSDYPLGMSPSEKCHLWHKINNLWPCDETATSHSQDLVQRYESAYSPMKSHLQKPLHEIHVLEFYLKAMGFCYWLQNMSQIKIRRTVISHINPKFHTTSMVRIMGLTWETPPSPQINIISVTLKYEVAQKYYSKPEAWQ